MSAGGRVKTFDDKAEAERYDRELAGKSEVLKHAIYSRKNPRRAPTPYGHMKTNSTAKVPLSKQGPHSLSFAAFEQRLQNRLTKGQHAQLADQVVTPEQVGPMMRDGYGLKENDRSYQRYMLD